MNTESQRTVMDEARYARAKTGCQRGLPGEARYGAARTDTLSGAYTARLGRSTPPAARPLPPVPPEPAPLADALMIPLRRSLEACKDTTHLRMLAAF